MAPGVPFCWLVSATLPIAWANGGPEEGTIHPLAGLQSTVAPDGSSFTAAEVPLTCRIADLAQSQLSSSCAILDLTHNALHSRPVSGNTTLDSNSTIRLLVEALKGANSPSSLLLSGSDLLGEQADGVTSDAFFAELAPALRGLHTLALDGCNLTSLHVEAVVNSTLVPASPLHTLSLARNHVGPLGATAIGRRLSEHSGGLSLASLQLTETALGGEGSTALSESISQGGGASLVRLALDQNGIGDDGAIELGRALARARGGALRVLDLSGNGIGPRGVYSFAQSLAAADDASRAAGLHELYLSSNSAGGDGAEALASLIERREHLHVLSVHDNAIPAAGADALERALRRGRSLSRLTGLRHNDAWPGEVTSRIEAAVARNSDALARAGAAPLLAEAQPPLAKTFDGQAVETPNSGAGAVGPL